MVSLTDHHYYLPLPVLVGFGFGFLHPQPIIIDFNKCYCFINKYKKK